MPNTISGSSARKSIRPDSQVVLERHFGRPPTFGLPEKQVSAVRFPMGPLVVAACRGAPCYLAVLEPNVQNPHGPRGDTTPEGSPRGQRVSCNSLPATPAAPLEAAAPCPTSGGDRGKCSGAPLTTLVLSFVVAVGQPTPPNIPR